MAIMNLFLLILSLQAYTVFSADRNQDIEEKVNVLLEKMTLLEKLGQLHQVEGFINGSNKPEHIKMAETGMIGSTLHVRGAKSVNEIQRAAMNSRLGIPLLFSFDVIHGYRTLFPIPLGETASFDLAAAEASAAVAAQESRSAGVAWTFAPMVDISRDPRWGRVMEGAGEDVFLATKMAVARVTGFQGSDYGKSTKVLACAKHFTGYGAAEAGREYNTVDISERRLRETYFPPFKAAVEAGVDSFMPAFNELNGIPAVANDWLLRDVLRKEWKFGGLIISDFNAVWELVNHGLALNNSEAAMYALNAGNEMEMNSNAYVSHGTELEKLGKVSMETINEAVRSVLRIKYRLNLFEEPYANETVENDTMLKQEFLDLARNISAKSFVLLKNEHNTLPISTESVKKLAVIGGLADDQPNSIDWWAADARADNIVTILQGIRDRVQNSTTTVTYAKGCESKCDSNQDFDTALAAANGSDFVILVVGETREQSGEAGSRTNIDLPGFQLDLIKAIHTTGKPYVVVIKNGRPLTLEWVAENSPAILITWLSGTMGGPAVADVLFGDVSPSGKLPMTFPRSVGQIPIHYDAKNTGRPEDPNNRWTSRYLDSPNSPRYPFGFGLSYTSFKYQNLSLGKSEIMPNENQTVTVEVENTGSRDGTEVVQLYIRDPVATITRPVRQLRGFTRVDLQAGEKKSVTFVLEKEHLGFLNREMKMTVEAGIIQVFVGGSSQANLMKQFTVIPGKVATTLSPTELTTQMASMAPPELTTQAASMRSFTGALLILTFLFCMINF